MTYEEQDEGFTGSQLWGMAWVLGLLAGGAWLRVAVLVSHSPHSLTIRVGLLLAVAAMASVFSAACVVLTGVKSAEHRILAITRRERD